MCVYEKQKLNELPDVLANSQKKELYPILATGKHMCYCDKGFGKI